MMPSQWMLLAGLVVLVFWMVGAYNRLVGLRNVIGTAWGQLDAHLQRRGQALTSLVQALRTHVEGDEGSGIASALAAHEQQCIASEALRARPARAEQAQNLATAEGVLASALARLFHTVELRPELHDDAAVASAMHDLRDLELHLGIARRSFNTAVDAYNDAVRQFPTRLLTGMFSFEEAGRL